ncbi:MAG: TonB-dependent receptor [Cytophagales bacterium]|nr:TonB-dependent receptor [Cytophagales bacterium]
MTPRTVLTLLVILTCIASGFAQSGSITLSGKIIDQVNNEPLPFATAVIKNKIDSSLIKGSVADLEGYFQISGIAPGTYLLEVSFAGYQVKTQDLFVGKLSNYLDLGTIAITPDQQVLDELVVEGERTTVSSQLDKKSYGVESNLAQSGGSVMDAMRTLPGVTVDQEGKIILRGSDRVTVLIDGQQSALTGFGNQKSLDNIPAANIERIEVINNPSAKYNAAGMAGIVNIIYKKDQSKGLTGEVGLNLGLGAIGTRQDDLPTDLGSFSANPKLIPNLNLNYQGSKVNYFLQSSVLLQEKLPNNEFTTRFYDDGRIIASQVPENRKQVHYIVTGGVDWKISEDDILTLSGIFDYESHVDSSQVPFINRHLDGGRNRYYAWNEEEITGLANGTLNFKHQFPQPGHTLSSTFQFTKGWEDESYFLQDSSAVRQSGDTTMLLAEEFTTSWAIDYVKPLGSGRVELGSRLQWRRIPVDYTVGRGVNSIIYPGLGDNSNWGENIYAGYVNYIFERPKYNIEGGLRAEFTDVFYTIDEANIYYDENDAYDYFEVFPNIRFTYNINQNNRFSAFYNRRIDRPGEPELRIFPKFDDPELSKVGDPYLRPQFTQALEIAYGIDWESGTLFLAGFQRWIDNQFLRIYNEDTSSGGNVINKIYQNTGPATNTGLEVILDQNITSFWKLSASVNWYINTIEDHQGFLRFPFERNYTLEASEDDTWDLKLNNQWEFQNGFKLQLTGVYYAPRNVPQGRQLERSSIDIGASKRIWKGKGELTASFTDIFNRFGINQQLTGTGFRANYQNFYETQVLRIGLKYKI